MGMTAPKVRQADLCVCRCECGHAMGSHRSLVAKTRECRYCECPEHVGCGPTPMTRCIKGE